MARRQCNECGQCEAYRTSLDDGLGYCSIRDVEDSFTFSSRTACYDFKLRENQKKKNHDNIK